MAESGATTLPLALSLPAGLNGDGWSPLTMTKLIAPRMPMGMVAINRHLRWIGPVLAHALTLVQAPSGYGKSTIAICWYKALSERGVRVGWISFEREDDDAARAFSYIFMALRMAGVPLDLAYDSLTPPQSLAAQLINAVFEFGEPVALFLDDLDRLSDQKVLLFLNYVLVHCPENLHLVCTCQAELELPLLFLDTHAMLVRVSTEELRLTDPEAHALLMSSAPSLNSHEARRLNEAMAGWVTGLRIGSAALRNNRDALLDIGLVSHGARWMSEYLDDNIFQHLTPDARQFLTRCAIVETLSADLCQVLSAQGNASRMLVWLADQNLFLQRLDDAGNLFRIHPVFREFLLKRLQEEDPAAIPALHSQASGWYAARGQMAEAISHAFDANDIEGAARLVNRAARDMLEHSNILALLGWIARLPDDVASRYLDLRLAEAWALTLTLRPQARQLMVEIAAQIEQIDDLAEAARIRHELAGLKTIFLAVFEDRLDAAISSGYVFLAHQTDENSFVTRAVRNAVAYCELKRGHGVLVHDIVRPSQLCAVRSEQLFTTAYRYSIVGLTHFNQGEAAEAERVFQTGLDLVLARNGRQSASAGLLSAFRARSLYERGDIDGASALLKDSLPIIDEAAFHEAVIFAYVAAIRIAALHLDMASAAALLEQVELIGHERQWRRVIAHCALERIRLRLPLTTDIDQLAHGLGDVGAACDLLDLDTRTYALVVKARCLDALVAGDTGRAKLQLDWLQAYAARSNNWFYALRTELMAIACTAMESPQFRISPLQAQFLGDAVTKGFGRTLLDGLSPLPKPTMKALLGEVPGMGQLLDSQAHLITPAIRRPRLSGATVFGLLTSREIEVLSCVSRGDSNKEIARQLHLTPETVKWHMKNILRKLDCDNRTDAVARASRLGLAISSSAPLS